jgi:hypothetical protein
MKKISIKIFTIDKQSSFVLNNRFFSLFLSINYLSFLKQFIFILMIIFLYNNNYKLM